MCVGCVHVGWSIAVVPGLFNFIQCAVSTRLDSVVGVGTIFKYSYFALDTNKFCSYQGLYPSTIQDYFSIVPMS